MQPDIVVESCWTIVGAEPQTHRGARWLARNCGWRDGTLWFEHRAGVAMICGAIDDGLVVVDVDTGAQAQAGVVS